MKSTREWGGRLVLAWLLSLAAGCTALTGDRWYKGNTHTHTWWSDGDSPPEVVVKGYVDRGYNFLVLSDHGKLSQGEKWVVPKGRRKVGIEKYEKEFPKTLQKRQANGQTEYRLKTFEELQTQFDRPGSFLMIQGEEISEKCGILPVHLNAINIKEVVPPVVASNVAEMLQKNVDAVLDQRKATGQPMLVHVNHPNFGSGVTAEDMVGLRGAQFFEVFNGHESVRNWGDEMHLSTDKIWDVVLSHRLGELKLPVMYGIGSDDAHHHVIRPGDRSNPGRGWVMVRAKKLTPEALVEAMEKGDFYASSGVMLQRIQFENGTLSIAIEPKPGVTYRTQFIGTPRNYDKSVTTRPADRGRILCEYSKEVGKVFAEASGTKAIYKLTGDELYVRAKIISSAKHPNPFAKGDVEMAWTQPVTGK